MKNKLLIVLCFISYLATSQVALTEDFNAGFSVPSGWTTGAGSTTTQSCDGRSIRRNVYSGVTTMTLTSPNQTGVSNGTDVAVSMDYKVVNWSAATVATPANFGTLELQFSIDNGSNWATFNTIDATNHVVSNTCATINATIDAVSVPSGSDIRFRALTTWNSGDYYMYYDNVSLLQAGACFSPTGVTNTVVTTSSADFSWTDSSSEDNGYDWEVVPDGNAQGTGIIVSGTTAANATNVTVSGLSANTNYDFYIRSNCSSNTSVWESPVSFITACGVESLDYTALIPDNLTDQCWEEAGSGDLASGPASLGFGNWGSSNYNGTPSNRINLYSDFSRGEWVLSPIIDMTGAFAKELNITVALTENGTSGSGADLGSDDLVAIVYSDDNGLTWNTLQSWSQGNVPSDTGEAITIDLSSLSGNVQFAFFADEGSVNDPEDVYFHISQFRVRQTPACIEPSNLIASNFTTTSADLAWTEGGSGESAWEIEYGVSGFSQGSGTVIAVTSNPYTLSSLTAGETYDYYVRANCSGGANSIWSTSTSFRIPNLGDNCETPLSAIVNADCAATGASTLSIDFSASQDILSQGCDTGTGNRGYYISFTAPASGNIEITHNGSNNEFRIIDNCATGTQIECGNLTSGQVISGLTPASEYIMTIWKDSFNSLTTDEFCFSEVTCLIPFGLTASNLQATSADLSWTSGGSGESAWEIEYGEDGFTQGTVDGTIISVSTNPYNLSGLLESTPYDYYVRATCGASDFSEWVGPFSFTTPASCLVPTALTASNITSSSADLSWTSGGSGESSWEVEYGTDGFTQGTGTTVSPATNPQSISGLIASEDYDYYVRANCGGGDFSEWAGPYSFTTACNAISSFPAFEDFEANNNCLDSQVTTGTTGWVRDASGGSGDISSSYDGLGFMEKNYTSSVAEFYSEPYDLSGESGNFRINVWLHRHGSAHINDNYDIYFNSSKSLTGATLITSMKSDIDEAPVVPSTGWYNYIYDVPIAYNSSNSVYFIVVGTTTAGFSSYDLGIDNLMMEKSPVDYIWNGASWNNTPEGNITTNDNMIVQVGTTPSLTSAISVGNLTLEAGASLEVDNGDITVTGNLENNGSITGVNQVILSGAAASVTGAGSMTNLTVDATGDVTMNGMQSISEQLDVVSGGQLDANGNITLVSNSMGTARVDVVDAGAITGNVNVERYIPAGNRAFRFIGSTVSGPSVYDSWQEAGVNATGLGVQITGTAGTAGTVNATTGHDETTTGNASMFKWDASNQSWTTVTNTKTEILNAGDYYRLFVRGDRMTDLAAATSPAHTETTLRASGSLMTGSMTVTPGIASGEFFAFANPYQSKLSTENIVATGVGADMYYWDPALGEFGGYSAIPYASASGTVGSAGVATNVLDAGQAVFFVDNSGSASVTIAESNKIDGTTNGGVFNVAPLQQALRLKIYQTSRFNNGQTESDGLYLDFNAAHNVNVDSNDAIKLNGLNVNMAITKPSGELLTVERRTLPTTNESLGLNITNYLTNAYTINATVDVLPGLTAYLKDNFTGTMTELVQGTSTAVDFTVDMNNAQSLDALRFELVFQVVTLSNEGVAFGSNLSIYPNPVKGDTITINIGDASVEKAQVQVFNTLGQQVMSNDYNNLSNGVIELNNLSDLSNGVYIINISSGDATTTRRFIKE